LLIDTPVAAAPALLVVGVALSCPMLVELPVSGEGVAPWLRLLRPELVVSADVVEAPLEGLLAPVLALPHCSETIRTSDTCSFWLPAALPVVSAVPAALWSLGFPGLAPELSGMNCPVSWTSCPT
jgi:hypothetical protein